MAKVYISSTKLDLAAEREAVSDWLVAANHQPVHSYQPDSETVRDSCLEDVDTCDLYVLILAHRYGFQPEENNPDNLSITHLEFRRAVETTKPVIALLRRSIPDISLSDMGNPARLALVTSFETEVRRAVRPAEFTDGKGLIEGLSTGIIRELEKLKGKPEPARQVVASDDPRTFQIVATLTEELARKNRLIDQQASRITDLEAELLRSAVARTLTAATQPDSGDSERTAVEELRAGNTAPAEAILNQQERQEAAQIGAPGADQTSRIKAAALAREQGALAMNHNVIAALESFERAAEYEPNDVWTHFFIGDLHVSLGNLGAAMKSFSTAVESVQARLQANAHDEDAQRDLSVGHDRIANVLLAQGDGPGALAAYQKGLEIGETLAARDPANTQWQRDLSVSHNKIGDVLRAQAEGPGALASYQKGLEIRERLSAREPANTQWQRDLSVSHERIGHMLRVQGDEPGALAAYQKGLEISERLTVDDPANTQWQRDLSVSYEEIGNVLRAQCDGLGALAAYQKGLAIGEKLVARDPANTQWQRDLSVSHERIGDVLRVQGDEPGALAAYKKGLEIRETLAIRDPANTQWQTDVAASCANIGTLTNVTVESRREYLTRGRGILVELREQNRLFTSQDRIAWFDQELSKLAEPGDES
jgi:tetratricopeptide (TPR) repeat protein